MRLLLEKELPNTAPPPPPPPPPARAAAVLLKLDRVKEELGDTAAGGVSARPNAVAVAGRPGWLRRGAGEECCEEPVDEGAAEEPPANELMRFTWIAGEEGLPTLTALPPADLAGLAAPLVDAIRLATARPHTAPPPPPPLLPAGFAPVVDGTRSLGRRSLPPSCTALATRPPGGDMQPPAPPPPYCPVLPPLAVRAGLSPPCDMARAAGGLPNVLRRTAPPLAGVLSPLTSPIPAGSSPLIGIRPSSTCRAASCAVMWCVTAGNGSPDLRRCCGGGEGVEGQQGITKYSNVQGRRSRAPACNVDCLDGTVLGIEP